MHSPAVVWQFAERVAVKNDVRSSMIELLPRLRKFAFALTGSSDQADDLVQDTCERALARMDQWVPGTRLDSWMYRIAQNIWLDRGRARKVRGEVVNIEDVPNLQGVDGREITEKRLTLEAVNAGMIRLTDDQRVLIALVCVDGLSYQEAADVLELPIGTVMSRLARARKTLSAAIGEVPETARVTRVEIKRA